LGSEGLEKISGTINIGLRDLKKYWNDDSKLG
jgi:hypothetical protein